MLKKRHYHGQSLPELLIAITISSLIVLVLFNVLLQSGRVWSQSVGMNEALTPSSAVFARINSSLLNAAYVRVPNLWSSGSSYTVGALVTCRFDTVDSSDPLQRNTAVYYNYRALQTHTASSSNKPSVNGNTAQWAKSYPWLIIYQAARDESNNILTPLLADMNKVAIYYLSDTSGTMGNMGTVLWCRTVNQNADKTLTNVSLSSLADNVVNLSFYTEKLSTEQVMNVNSVTLTVLGTDKQQQKMVSFGSGISFRNPVVQNIPPLPIF